MHALKWIEIAGLGFAKPPGDSIPNLEKHFLLLRIQSDKIGSAARFPLEELQHAVNFAA